MGYALAIFGILGGIVALSKFSKRRKLDAKQMANLIERFLNGCSTYPQEWNDFIDSSQIDGRLDVYRRRCYELDPLINKPGTPDKDALETARLIVRELREVNDTLI